MHASQYGEEPDSAYGDEMYVQSNTPNMSLEGNSVDKDSIIEGVTPHHWHPTSQIIKSKTIGDTMPTKKAVRRAIPAVENII